MLNAPDHAYNVLIEFFLQKISGFYEPPPLSRITEKMGGGFSYLDVKKMRRVTAPQNTTRNFTTTLKKIKKLEMKVTRKKKRKKVLTLHGALLAVPP